MGGGARGRVIRGRRRPSDGDAGGTAGASRALTGQVAALAWRAARGPGQHAPAVGKQWPRPIPRGSGHYLSPPPRLCARDEGGGAEPKPECWETAPTPAHCDAHSRACLTRSGPATPCPPRLAPPARRDSLFAFCASQHAGCVGAPAASPPRPHKCPPVPTAPRRARCPLIGPDRPAALQHRPPAPPIGHRDQKDPTAVRPLRQACRPLAHRAMHRARAPGWLVGCSAPRLSGSVGAVEKWGVGFMLEPDGRNRRGRRAPGVCSQHRQQQQLQAPQRVYLITATVGRVLGISCPRPCLGREPLVS